MPKLIKKFLNGGQYVASYPLLPNTEELVTNYFKNNLQKSALPSLSTTLKPLSASTPGFKIPDKLPISQPTQIVSKPNAFVDGLKSAGSAIGTEALGAAPQLAEAGIQALGGQKAEVSSGGEQAFSKFSDVAFKGALKTGNPYAIAGAAVIKGLDFLNQYGGKKSDTQKTLGINTGGYTTQSSTLAGKQFTMLGGSKRRKVNRLTDRTDR